MTTQQTEQSADVAQTMTIHGRVYTLIEGTRAPHYVDESGYVSVRGYPGMWSAQTHIYGPGARVMCSTAGDGATPEEALAALTVDYGDMEAQWARMVALVETARGAGKEAAE